MWWCWQQEEEDSAERQAGVLRPSVAAARLTVMALKQPLQLYVGLQCFLHVASLLADYADHLPKTSSRHPFCALLPAACAVCAACSQPWLSSGSTTVECHASDCTVLAGIHALQSLAWKPCV